MAHHNLKAHYDSFELIALRKSEVQLRKNDRDYKVGDTCTFYEFNHVSGIFTGKCTVKVPIVTILENHEGLTPGWCLVVVKVPDCNICRNVVGICGKKEFAEFEDLL